MLKPILGWKPTLALEICIDISSIGFQKTRFPKVMTMISHWHLHISTLSWGSKNKTRSQHIFFLSCIPTAQKILDIQLLLDISQIISSQKKTARCIYNIIFTSTNWRKRLALRLKINSWRVSRVVEKNDELIFPLIEVQLIINYFNSKFLTSFVFINIVSNSWISIFFPKSFWHWSNSMKSKIKISIV